MQTKMRLTTKAIYFHQTFISKHYCRLIGFDKDTAIERHQRKKKKKKNGK
jgi:cytoskeletal protein RodZ